MVINTTKILVLPTQPRLLRSRFSMVRKSLTGVTTSLSGNDKNIVKKSSSWSFIFNNKIVSSFVDKAAVVAIALSVLAVIILVVPQIYYAFTPVDTVPITANQQASTLGGSFDEGTKAVEEVAPKYIPEKDETLPEGEWLIIPRIGVRTFLHSTEESEEALAKGVWNVPGYGEAGSTDLPMILAAHRFGWEWWWQSDYWKYNSFYLLPDTEPGDTIEIISDQRKWVYEIYDGAEGDAIADYDADLILYTCKFLNSPVRHFRYARLLDPTVNTQAASL